MILVTRFPFWPLSVNFLIDEAVIIDTTTIYGLTEKMELPIAVIALGWALVAYVIYFFVSAFVTSRRRAAKARELKCEEPPFQKNKYPFGIDNLMRALEADKVKRFPPDMVQRTIDVGAITYKYQVLGATNISTSDEKNVQAILATQFNDFGEPSSYLLKLIVFPDT